MSDSDEPPAPPPDPAPEPQPDPGPPAPDPEPAGPEPSEPGPSEPEPAEPEPAEPEPAEPEPAEPEPEVSAESGEPDSPAPEPGQAPPDTEPSPTAPPAPEAPDDDGPTNDPAAEAPTETPEPSQDSPPNPDAPNPDAPNPDTPNPDAPESGTPDQDSWLKTTFGLDPAAFATPPIDPADAANSMGGRLAALVAGPPMPRGEIGEFQEEKAAARLEAMGFFDRRKVRVMLDEASPQDRKYLEKALASAHGPDELEAFAKQIADKDEAWKQDHLHLVGESDGRGIKQQWSNTCNATVVEAMKGELDPVYAMKMHEQNPNLEKSDENHPETVNPKLAADQKEFYDDYKDPDTQAYATVAPRSIDQPGVKLDKALDDQAKATGLDFNSTAVGPDTVERDLSDIAEAAGKGMPTPLRIADGADNGHFVLVSGVDPGPPRVFHIHDPYEGKMVNVTEDDLKSGNFDIAGHNKLSRVFKPSPAKVK